MEPGKKDHLEAFRKNVLALIASEYPTIEKFCYENDIPKSLMSRFMNESGNQFRIATLAKIAKALEKSLDVRLL